MGQSEAQPQQPKPKRKKRKVRYGLSEEDAELLERYFGSVKAGIKELVRRFKHSLGPKEPRLKAAFNALISEAEKFPSFPFMHCIEVIMQAVGCDRDAALKIFRELMRDGYLDWDPERRGWVKPLMKRSDIALPPPLDTIVSG